MTGLGYLVIALLLVVTLFAMWKPHQLRKVIHYIARDEMPIWLSIALAISAAVGTYFLAPLINENFEFQKNRSQHIMETVKTINDDFVEVTTDVRKFNDDLFFSSKSLGASKGNLLDKISELQWRLIDVSVIIRRAGGSDKCVGDLKTSLEGLRVSVVEARKPADQETVIESYKSAASKTEGCLDVLYSAARLS